MSIQERMREFRRRHPGYDREYKRKQRAELKAFAEAKALAAATQLAAAPAVQLAKAEVQAQPAPARVLLTLPVPTYRLALPAPVVDPTLVALNEMATRLRAATRVEELLLVHPPASKPG